MTGGAINPWTTLITQWDAWVLTAVIVIGFPLLGRSLYGRLRSYPTQPNAPQKLRIYGGIIAVEWILTGALFILARRHSLTLGDLGEHPGILSRSIIILTMLLAVFAVLVIQNVRQIRKTDPEKLAKELQRIRRFLPGSHAETAVFPWIALTSGICEELIYRGWLVNFLRSFTHSLWISVVLGAAAFGIAHAYQGFKGMFATGFLGLIFGIIFITTNSLFPGQVLHFAINLVNGLIGAYSVSLLNSTGRASPAATSPPV